MGRYYHCKLTAIMLMLTSPAMAKEFLVTDQDQANVTAICELGTRAPTLQVEAIAQIATWCVQWKQRVQSANSVKPSDQKPPDK